MEQSEDKKPPIKVGDVIRDQEVISLGKKGEGVVKYQGYILFIRDCNKGDIIDFRVTKIFPNFGIGEVIKEE